MSHFLLVLHNHPGDFADLDAAEAQRILEEYLAWRARLQASGRYLGSNKLHYEGGRHLRLDQGTVRVTDGPFAEAKEVIGGYFLFAADDYDQATEIVRDHPHLRYGRWIELRQVDPRGHG